MTAEDLKTTGDANADRQFQKDIEDLELQSGCTAGRDREAGKNAEKGLGSRLRRRPHTQN